MVNLSDYELQKNDAPRPRSETRSVVRWMILSTVLVAVAAAAARFVFFADRQGQPQTDAAQNQAAAAAKPAAPLGGAGAPIDLPPLADTDPLVRLLVRGLSTHPAITAWLATDGLLRNFTVVVDNIAEGVAPAPRLRMLRPQGRFRIIDREDELLIDPRSYQRYAAIAAAVDSLNPNGVASLYSTLKPRIEEAYAELGNAGTFDARLEQAFVAMLRTPALDGNVPLVTKGAVMYAFENPALERLTPAQKQLARMGPENVRLIQARLRQIAAALGIPADRLPPE